LRPKLTLIRSVAWDASSYGMDWPRRDTEHRGENGTKTDESVDRDRG